MRMLESLGSMRPVAAQRIDHAERIDGRFLALEELATLGKLRNLSTLLDTGRNKGKD